MSQQPFEIIIEDMWLTSFSEYCVKRQNENLLALGNDFEDGKWRLSQFLYFIWNNIDETALNAEERQSLIEDKRHAELVPKSIRNLRFSMDKDLGKGSEIAEIALYGIMRRYYGANSVVPKIYYKQNRNDTVKGADSVHIVIDQGKQDFSIWLGEAKFFKKIDYSSVTSSVLELLDRNKIKKENAIITSLKDLSLEIDDAALVTKIKKALSEDQSIDKIRPKLHVPILILYECNITQEATEWEAYKNQIKEEHTKIANNYFEKQYKKSSTINAYSKMNFHLILFPVPNKKEIIDRFYQKAERELEEMEMA